MPPPRFAFRAFSLLELVFSLGLLTVALVTLATLFIQLFQSGQKGGHTASGVHAAETVLSQQLHAIWHGSHPTLTQAAFWAADGTVDGDLALGATSYSYTVDRTTVPVASALPGNRLKLVHVTVWWSMPDADSTRQGQGRLRVELRRLVNENDAF